MTFWSAEKKNSRKRHNQKHENGDFELFFNESDFFCVFFLLFRKLLLLLRVDFPSQ